MSFTLLGELEGCPRRWALEHAQYPGIWNGHGYPARIHMAGLLGSVVHLATETIVKALVQSGCRSLDDPAVTDTMRRLGGYTSVIDSCTTQVLEPYETNPRVEHSLSLVRTSLRTRVPDIRSQVHILLRRVRFPSTSAAYSGGDAARTAGREWQALSTGIHPEVEMRAPEMGWRGRADLVVISDSHCEIIDFKTGKRGDAHAFQMCVYALLWYRDSALNPKSTLANRLTLSYLDGDVSVTAPTHDELSTLESELRDRTRTALDALDECPPRARPSLEVCRYCDVRHLCEDYWDPQGPGGHGEGLATQSNLVDAEITLLRRLGPSTWTANVEMSQALELGSTLIVHVPVHHHSHRTWMPRFVNGEEKSVCRRQANKTREYGINDAWT